MKAKSKIAVNIALTALSTAGTISTAIFAVKDYKKHAQYPKPDESITKFNKVAIHLKDYWRTYVLGGLTIGTNILNCSLGCYSVASAATAIGALSISHNNLRKAIKENVSEEDYKKIIKSLTGEITPPEGEKVYYNEYTGVFTAKPTDVLNAQKLINDQLNDQRDNGLVYIKDFLKYANAKLENEGNFIPYQDYGWDREYLSYVGDLKYIHIIESDTSERYGSEEDDIQTVNIITFMEDPIYFGDE